MGKEKSYIDATDFSKRKIAYLVIKHDHHGADLIMETREYVDAVMTANLSAQAFSKSETIELLKIWGDKEGAYRISYKTIKEKTLKRTIESKKFKEKKDKLGLKRGIISGYF